nr:hypothetical protein CFP56_71161 [Quercus suber]
MGCPDYDKLRQLFAPNTTTGALEISFNTLAPNSDEERVLEEELTNDVCRTSLGHDDYYSLSLEGIPRNDCPCPDQMQCADKPAIGDPCSLGKAIEVLNQHEDLDDDVYLAVSTTVHPKENRVVFMGMPEHRRKNWMEIVAKRNLN